MASGPQLGTPLPRAGGQDDVSLKETPSNFVDIPFPQERMAEAIQ